MERLKDLENEYLEYLRIDKKYSENTINTYQNNLNHFTQFFNNKDISSIKENDFDSYRKYLFENLKLDSPSICNNISTLKSFYKYLMLFKGLKKNSVDDMELPKRKKTLPKTLTIDEVDSLLDIDIKDYYDYRNKAMLELMYSSGLRVSELVNIQNHDIDFDNACVRVFGKGSKERILPISDYALDALKIYIINAKGWLSKGKASEYLFLNNHGDKITRQAFFKIIKKIGFEKGIKTNFSPHTLRHSFATSMLNNGAELNAVKELLGHSSLASTSIYTHTTFEELKKVYHAHPRAQKEGGLL